MRTGACVAAALAAALLGGLARADEKPRVPLYTNDDLRRVSGERGETGVTSTPAVPPTAVAEDPPSARGEAYWRAEAEKVRRRVLALRQKQAAFRGRLEDEAVRERGRLHDPRRAEPRSTRRELELQVESLEARIRWEEGRLEERARRARALPGWLR